MSSTRMARGALRQTQTLTPVPGTWRSGTQHLGRRISTNRQPNPGRNSRQAPQEGGNKGKLIGLLTVFALGAGAAYTYPVLFPGTDVPKVVEKKYQKATIEYEKARPALSTKDASRDAISSQHLQVKQSWENPGVYAWGSNAGKVIDPDSKETYVKLPRRLAYFDGQLLRDLKLTQHFGAAVNEHGDLVQWGLGFSKDSPKPVETVKGRDIVKISVSADRIVALTSNGTVFSVPAACPEGVTPTPDAQSSSSSSSWIPFWSSGSGGLLASHARNMILKGLSSGEKVVDVRSGLQHCLLLTSKGRVFSAASSTTEFPSKGQMGVPGLSWSNRPQGAFDQPHELVSLSGFTISKIAAGDYHSAVLDKDGRVFTFGDNTYGQLGIQPEGGFRTLDVPTLLPVSQLYSNTGLAPKVTSIAAGGQNTFFTVDAQRPDHQNPAATAGAGGDQLVAPSQRISPVTADTWACGNGVYGSLGTGRWQHVTDSPVKVKALSALSEFDENANKMVPIRLSDISVGSTHASATMDNVTWTAAASGRAGSEADTNWGADVLFWGGNEFYQLGTGKRSNLNAPTYIGAMDGGGGAATAATGGGEFHRFQLTPRKTVRLGQDGKGRKVTMQQKVECGRFVSGVYSST